MFVEDPNLNLIRRPLVLFLSRRNHDDIYEGIIKYWQHRKMKDKIHAMVHVSESIRC